jgi:hypothetical protein
VTTRCRIGNHRIWVLACSAGVLLSLPVFAGAPDPALGGQSSTSSAQAARRDYALIYGTVWGPGDHPVAGVPISIRRASDKKAKWQQVSDRSGEFAQRVPVGAQDYVVQADIKMPKGQPKPEVTVHIDNDERKDISLHLSK